MATTGKVILLAGGGKVYADIAARFCRSEEPIEKIIEKPYSPKIIENLLSSGHLSALEFDYFLFAVEGFSRVCEVQLVRKRMASYMIKSGREELKGKRAFEVYLPKDITDFKVEIPITAKSGRKDILEVGAEDICSIISKWYDAGLELGKPEENLRYMKPQATTFKAIIGMNAHALRDFFAQRMCLRAQAEIRNLAALMYLEVMEVAPDLFKKSGAKCAQLGYCPENERQHPSCNRITHKEVLELIATHGPESYRARACKGLEDK